MARRTRSFFFDNKNGKLFTGISYTLKDIENQVEGTASIDGTKVSDFARSAIQTGAQPFLDNDTSILTAAATDNRINAVVNSVIDSAPGALDTLNELAAALGDDANFSTTVTNSLALKAPLASPTFTGTPIAPTATAGTNTTQIATTAFVSTAVSAVTITDNSVGAAELNVSGSGTSGQILTSDGDGSFSWTTASSGISNLVEDTTPQLGGNLDTNGKQITITGSGLVSYSGDDINITGYGGSAAADISLQTYGDYVSLGGARGDVKIQGIAYPKSDGTNGQVLTTNGSGTLSFADASGGISNLVEDTTPQLGGALETNGNAIIPGGSNYTLDFILPITGNFRVQDGGANNATIASISNQFGSVGGNLWLYDGSGPTITMSGGNGNATFNGTLTASSLTYPTSDGTNGQVLTTNGSGTLSFADASGGISNLVEDTTPQLGGNLDATNKTISNLGSISGSSDYVLSVQGSNTANAGTLYLQASNTSGGTLDVGGGSLRTTTLNVAASTVNIQGLTYPSSDGTNGQVLTTNGSGTLSFSTISGYTDSDVATYLSTNGYATASNIVATITDSAPTTLNTLNELAAALGDDPNFATTVSTSIGEKLAKASNLSDLTNISTARTNLGLGSLATLSSVNAATIADNSVGAAALNVSGGGTSGQILTSAGDGSFSWTTASSGSPFAASLLHTLDNPNPYSTSLSDWFGWSVAISGNYAIVGTYNEDDAGGTTSGKAYIFDVTTSTLLHTLDNPNAYNTSLSDYFGTSVAISGNYAIVGAEQEDDAGGSSSGKAYIFNVTTGALVHTLNNPSAYSTSSGDRFGSSVAISGNYAIVGAYAEDDASGTTSGKAYIYNVTTGALLHTLDNPNPYDTSASDYFTNSVAISGNYAIVGAYYEDDAGGSNSGKAYIYNVSTGSLVHTLNNPNAYSTSDNDYFGTSVAISGNYAIVGASDEDDAGGASSGKAYIFNVATGALVHTLNNPNAYSTSASDRFGAAVAISGNYAIVGAYREDDAGGTDSGKAYIFNVIDGSLVATIDNPNAYSTSASDRFSWSVAISGNYALVGVYLEDDAGGTDSGKAYIYQLSAPGYTPTTDEFGSLVQASSGSGGISNLVEDTTPQLGGALDAQTNNITNAAFITGSGNLWLYTGINSDIYLGDAEKTSTVHITGTTSVSIQGLTYPSSGGTNGQVLTTNGSGTLSFADKNVEIFGAKTSATGTVAHDLNTAAVFRHTSISANFTANFTNADTTNDRTTSVALILVQGGTARMPTAVQIGGASQTIQWQGGSAPSGTANGTDVVSFTLIRSGSAWTVIGSATSYS